MLFEAPKEVVLAMFMILFFCVALAMLIQSYIFPSLISDAHDKTRYLDGLRGIAAVLVALNHAPLALVNLNIVPKTFIFIPLENQMFNFLGSIGVQLFFCITGMLFANKLINSKEIDWSDFFEKRVRRLVPAYIFAAFLAIAITIWFIGLTEVPIYLPLNPVEGSVPFSSSQISVINSIPQIFSFGILPLPNFQDFNMARLLGVNWSLAIEWRFYLALPIIFVFSRHYCKGVLITILVFALLDLLLNQSGSWTFFIIGALGSFYMRREFNTLIKLIAHLVALGALAVLFFYNFGAPLYGFIRWVNLAILFISIVVGRPWILTVRAFVAMGTVSYSFYLFHVMTLFVVLAVCNQYFFEVATLSIKPYTLLTGSALTLAAMISTLSYLFVERPFMRGYSFKKKKSINVL